jgi:hypothetical protein
MFLNNDLLFVVGSVIFIAGGIFTFRYATKYNIFTTGESLVNTNSDLSNNLPSTSTQLIDASVQTTNIQIEAGVQAANTYVNTGMQTSARMWYESIRNWINDILGPTTSHSGPGYVDVGVQTNAISTWQTVKQWFLDACSIRSSELSSLGQNKVTKWRTGLDSIQSVDLPNSESPLTSLAFCSPNSSTLDNLLDPNDSASNISEVVSEANLQNVEPISNRVYDMSNIKDVLDLMNDPTVVFSIDPVSGGEDLITFYTAESANEILRSTLETILG